MLVQVQKQDSKVQILASSGRAASIIMPDVPACQAGIQLIDNVLIPASVCLADTLFKIYQPPLEYLLISLSSAEVNAQQILHLTRFNSLD